MAQTTGPNGTLPTTDQTPNELPPVMTSHRVLARPLQGERTMIPMTVLEIVFAAGWAAFWLYWIAAAFSMKRGRVPWSREIGIRVVLLVVIVALIHAGAFRHHTTTAGPWRASVALVLFVVGLACAIWARLHISRNWGTPMTRKNDPALVTSGPYHFIRHPIYSGILLAGVGTTVGLNWHWLIVMGLVAVYFVYSATVEERYLAERFPDAYNAYKRSTKMLVPFIF